MRKHCVPLFLGVVLLVGCAPPNDRGGEHYELATDMRELMDWIIDPASGVIWGAAGTITTAEGVEDLAPTTPEGWTRVRNNAAIIAESGNLLMLPGRAVDDEDWMDFSRGLVDVGRRLVDIAEAEDPDALFTVGGHLYNVCVACHQIYLLPGQETPEL